MCPDIFALHLGNVTRGSRMSTKGEEMGVEYLINVHGHQEQKSSDQKAMEAVT